MNSPSTPYPFADAALSDIPQIEAAARTAPLVGASVKIGDEYVRQSNIIFADDAIFDIMTLPLQSGNRDNLLTEPNSVVLSERSADKLFPDRQAVGHTIRMQYDGEDHEFRVTGVMEKPAGRTTFAPNYMLSISASIPHYDRIFDDADVATDWTQDFYTTYLLLPDGFDVAKLYAMMPEFRKRYHPDVMASMDYRFQKMSDIYLHSSNLANNHIPQGNATSVYIFTIIALLILFIAGINYAVLASARAVTRAPEIGVRRILGAGSLSVAWQFLLESLLVAVISLIVAFVMVEVSLPYINQLFDKHLGVDSGGIARLIPVSLLFCLVIALISGGYVAFHVSRIRAVTVIKGKLYRGTAGVKVRRALIAIQLIILIALIMATLTVYSQLHYAQIRDLGFDRNNLLMLSIHEQGFADKVGAFKAALKRNPDVIDVTAGLYLPPSDSYGKYQIPAADDPNRVVVVEGMSVDFDFIDTYGCKIVEGRAFSREFGSDSLESMIVNQTAVRELGLTDPIGKEVLYGKRIIGVVEDFYVHSLHNKITPMLMTIDSKYVFQVAVKLNPANVPAIMSYIEGVWKEFLPESPFSYGFFDESLRSLYSEELGIGRMMLAFTALAIFVACLGLFSMASFSAEQRTKEIGIRKSLGASVSDLVILLSKETALLVVVATVAATPVAYLIMSDWLNNFAYRITLGPLIFIAAGALALAIALATVGLQASRAAMANPVDSLRHE